MINSFIVLVNDCECFLLLLTNVEFSFLCSCSSRANRPGHTSSSWQPKNDSLLLFEGTKPVFGYGLVIFTNRCSSLQQFGWPSWVVERFKVWRLDHRFNFGLEKNSIWGTSCEKKMQITCQDQCTSFCVVWRKGLRDHLVTWRCCVLGISLSP